MTALPALITAGGERTAWRFMEFFTAAIRNPNARRAYGRDVRAFLAWCADAGIPSILDVTTVEVATYIEQLGRSHPAPAVKRHLRHYAERLSRRFEAFVDAPFPTAAEPVAACGLCRWRNVRTAQWVGSPGRNVPSSSLAAL